MKVFEFELDNDIDDDLRRSISFISDKIVKYEINGQKISLYYEAELDEVELRKQMNKLLLQKKRDKEETYYTNEEAREYFTEEDILKGSIVERYYDGSIMLDNIGIKLFDFFDQFFVSILDGMSVIQKKYPTSIEMETLINTGYLANSPHHPMLCTDICESMDQYDKIEEAAIKHELKQYTTEFSFALSPSACFSLYKELKGKDIKDNIIYTFRQNVFRNEGRFNWNELHRLRDYNVREIVFIGDKEFVAHTREELLQKTIQLLNSLGLCFKVEIASDPFILPELQNYRKIQQKFKVKYEVRVLSGKQDSIACASFNLHGGIFAKRFNFSVCENKITESGCIGFGIERCIIAFLHQYGLDIDKWPAVVKDYIIS